MSRSSVPSYTSLAIERILKEYTDNETAISMRAIRNYLSEIYGIHISEDNVRKQVKGIIAFSNLSCPRDAADKKIDDYDTPCLFPGTEVEFCPQGSGAGKLTGVRVTRRTFDDAEVAFIIGAVSAVSGTNPNRGGDFMRRIKSLQGNTVRYEEIRELPAATNRYSEISLTEFMFNYLLLRDAVDTQCSTSFDYEDYTQPQIFSVVRKRQGAQPDVSDINPYGIAFTDGHCLLLVNANTNEESCIAYRVDFMSKVSIGEPSVAHSKPAASATAYETLRSA